MKKDTALYTYLEATGVLDQGSKEDIILAKKLYWTEVRKAWKNERQQVCKSYTVFLDAAEQLEIQTAATSKAASITSFIKTSAILAARGNSGVSKVTTGSVRKEFFAAYDEVEKILANQVAVPEKILNCVAALENKVLELIR